MVMPELKCFSISCHIPGFGFRKGSSSSVPALPDLPFFPALPDLPVPQAIKTCMDKNWILRSGSNTVVTMNGDNKSCWN